MNSNLYQKIFIVLFLILFFIVIVSMVWISNRIKDSNIDQVSDNITTIFRQELDVQQSNALFLSVALSQNRDLKDALITLDEEQGAIILSNVLKNLQTYTFVEDVRMQILTEDLIIFARSWDNTYVGMPLASFREDLHRIKKLRRPKVSIDPGRLLTIKATTPIVEDMSTVGYIETVKTFDEITSKLRKNGIELMVLMKEKYLDIATLMRENPYIGDYIIANKNFNSAIFKDFQDQDLDVMMQKIHMQSKKYLYIFDIMLDGVGDNIGYYVLAIPLEEIERFADQRLDISFFLKLSQKDLYSVVGSWEEYAGSYASRYDKQFIKLLDSVEESDRVLFESEAREILGNYTKDELIDIILEKSYKIEKSGVIK